MGSSRNLGPIAASLDAALTLLKILSMKLTVVMWRKVPNPKSCIKGISNKVEKNLFEPKNLVLREKILKVFVQCTHEPRLSSLFTHFQLEKVRSKTFRSETFRLETFWPESFHTRHIQTRNIQTRNIQTRNIQTRNIQTRNFQIRNLQTRNIETRQVTFRPETFRTAIFRPESFGPETFRPEIFTPGTFRPETHFSH